MKSILLILFCLLISGCGIVTLIKCGTAPRSVCKAVEFVGFEL